MWFRAFSLPLADMSDTHAVVAAAADAAMGEEDQLLSSSTSEGKSKKQVKRKRGAGAGGKHRHYSTMITPEMRVKEYPEEPFEAMESSSGPVLHCHACGKCIGFATKSQVDQHLTRACHKEGVERLKAKKKFNMVAKPVAKPAPLTGRQNTLDNHTQVMQLRKEAQDDLVLTFLCAGIPIEKIDNLAFRKWLTKNTTIHGYIPVLSSTFPQQNIQRLSHNMLMSFREKFADRDLVVSFDEWTDGAGNATIAVLMTSAALCFAVDVIFLEGQGPSSGVENKEVSAQLVNTMSRMALDTHRIKYVCCDEGSVMVAAYNRSLNEFWPKSKLILCMAHKLDHIGKVLQKNDDFRVLGEVLFMGAYMLSVPKNAARKRRWLNFLKSSGELLTDESIIPPKVGSTRWNAWVDAAHWWCQWLVKWKAFIVEEFTKAHKRETTVEPKTLLEKQHELLTTRLTITAVKLAFAADHTAALMTALNFVQKNGVVAPFLLDVLLNVQTSLEELVKTKKYSPRTEELLSKLKNSSAVREMLNKAAEQMLDATKQAFANRKFTMDVLKEMRVLNPNNLLCVSHMQCDYPILFAHHDDLAYAWGVYCRTLPPNLPQGDDAGPALKAWWEAQPDSMLKEYALFLLHVPFSSASVERFFSKSTLQDDQLTMGEAMRRAAFLCRFNGDVLNQLL